MLRFNLETAVHKERKLKTRTMIQRTGNCFKKKKNCLKPKIETTEKLCIVLQFIILIKNSLLQKSSSVSGSRAKNVHTKGVQF